MAIGNRPESEEMPPTQAEERKRLAGTYDNILVIDTVIASGNERLQLHVKHYCLKDSSLIIPKRYDDESAKPADFVTHPFVSDMVLINGKDTVLNKQFTAKDFYPFFNDPFVGNLKKYGSLLEPRVSHRSDNNNNIIITYSLSIPTTDLGIPVELNISKNGSYKIKAGY